MQNVKFSRFNIWTKTKTGELIIYNSMTGALATFEKRYSDTVLYALENDLIPSIPSELINDFMEDGYIIENDIDEFKKINALVKIRQGLIDEYFLSILLNLDCNFKCYYCFESHTGKYLEDIVAQKMLLMFDKISKKAKKISVDWYGGEPLLSFHKLMFLNDKFIEICKTNNVQYNTSITTNGYLLSSSIFEYLKNTPVTHLQITLDGPAKTHNASRPLKNGGPTFNVILDNIKTAVNSGIKVLISVNVTKLNIDQIPELYQILEKQELKNRVQIILKPVVSSSAHPCKNQCLSANILGNKITAIYKQMAKNGWIVFPNIDTIQCMGFCLADFPSRFIVDIQGNLYKCGELFTPEEAIGKIGNEGDLVLDQNKHKQFIEKNPLNFPECKNCNILPICMGGCNMKRFWKDTNCCDELKYGLTNFLEVLVLNQYNIDQDRR